MCAISDDFPHLNSYEVSVQPQDLGNELYVGVHAYSDLMAISVIKEPPFAWQFGEHIAELLQE